MKETNSETNKFTEGADMVNNMIDTMFKVFNLSDSEKYHVSAEDVKNELEKVSEKIDVVKDHAEKIKDNVKIDFSNLVTTLNDIFTKYKDTYNIDAEHVKETEENELWGYPMNEHKEYYSNEENCVDDPDCSCGDCDCCPYMDECVDDDLDDYFDEMNDEPVQYDKDYCHSIRERLKNELEYEKQVDAAVEDGAYPYHQVLQDINDVLDDPENADYEFIHAKESDTFLSDAVHVKYHIGYNNTEEKEMYTKYTYKLREDLKDLYGFTDVYISVINQDDEEYMTYDIYMLI